MLIVLRWGNLSFKVFVLGWPSLVVIVFMSLLQFSLGSPMEWNGDAVIPIVLIQKKFRLEQSLIEY